MAQRVNPPKSIDPSRIVITKPASHSSGGSEPAPPLAPAQVPPPLPPPVFSQAEELSRLRAQHPLVRFSNREHADQLDAEAADTKPLVGEFIMDGQATMIYAPPNTGKTLIVLYLIIRAIEEGRIDPNGVFYFNADDSSRGLAVKNRLMQEVGAHMLAPGRRGLRLQHLPEMMLRAVREGSARGTLIIIDTLKKFADPMSKKESSEFAQVCREYVMAGGTIVALGHTRKNPKADGTYQYQGTTDIMEDFDAVYIATPSATAASGQRVVLFQREKKRADSPDLVAYSYADNAGISYDEKLASVELVDPEDLSDYGIGGEEVVEYRVAAMIEKLIDGGFSGGKMALAKAAAEACGVSRRGATAVLERYTGTTVGQHYWNRITGPHNKQKYVLIPKG